MDPISGYCKWIEKKIIEITGTRVVYLNCRILESLQNTFYLFFFTGSVLGVDLTESCKMIVQMCTAIYKSKLNKESGSDEHVCLTLQSYKLCLDRSAGSCTGDRPFDTLLTVVSRLLHSLCSDHNISGELKTNSSLV